MTASGNIRNRNAQLGEVLQCQAVQTFIHSHAQFEDATLGNIQPVKVTVEDVTILRPLSNIRVPEVDGKPVGNASARTSTDVRTHRRTDNPKT